MSYQYDIPHPDGGPSTYPGAVNDDGTITVVAQLTFRVTDRPALVADSIHMWDDGVLTVAHESAALVRMVAPVVSRSWAESGVVLEYGMVSVGDEMVGSLRDGSNGASVV